MLRWSKKASSIAVSGLFTGHSWMKPRWLTPRSSTPTVPTPRITVRFPLRSDPDGVFGPDARTGKLLYHHLDHDTLDDPSECRGRRRPEL